MVVLGGEGSDEVVLELFLYFYGGVALENFIDFFEFLQLVDQFVFDDGHSPQQYGEGKGLLVEFVVDPFFFCVELLLAVLQQSDQVREVKGQIDFLGLPLFFLLIVLNLINFGERKVENVLAGLCLVDLANPFKEFLLLEDLLIVYLLLDAGLYSSSTAFHVIDMCKVSLYEFLARC